MNKGMTLFLPAEYFTKKFHASREGSCNIYARCLTHCSAAERADKWVKRCGGKNEESVTVSYGACLSPVFARMRREMWLIVLVAHNSFHLLVWRDQKRGKGQGVNRSNLVQISLTTLSGVDKVARCFATSPLSF